MTTPYPPHTLITSRTDNTPMGAGVHSGDHNAVNLAVNTVVTELGTNPSGPYTDVNTRLDATLIAVNHGAVATTTRPAVTFVMWIGNVEPVNAIDGDVWIDTT